MVKLKCQLDPVQRMVWRGLFSAPTHCCHSTVRSIHWTNTLGMQMCQLWSLAWDACSLASGLLLAAVVPIHIYSCTLGASGWPVWKVCSSARDIPRGPREPLTQSSMQISPSHACMPVPGQRRVPCIGIPVTREVWEQAAAKQTSAIQLPKIALSQKRQCYFCRSVLNQLKYSSGAKAIIQ